MLAAPSAAGDAADTQRVRPRLVALALAVLLTACPDQVRLANGTRFTCTVLIEGTKAAYAVTVRCGTAKVRVVEVGASIACTITLGDAVQRVAAEVKDLKGTVVVRG